MAEDPRADHAQVPGALRGPAQEPPGQRRPLPVQEHLSAGLGLTVNRSDQRSDFSLCLCMEDRIVFTLYVVYNYFFLQSYASSRMTHTISKQIVECTFSTLRHKD